MMAVGALVLGFVAGVAFMATAVYLAAKEIQGENVHDYFNEEE